MLGQLRGAASRIPVVGPKFKQIYLKLFAGEGSVRPIRSGPLEGMRYYRYRWSTPSEDLVVTNWDDEAIGAFVKNIPGKRRFFDIGANWGFYGLLAQKHRDPGCQIVAFEPNPQSAKELETQLHLNNVANATVVAAAVSNSNGTMEFIDTGSAIGQKLAAVDNHFRDARRITVPTITLDSAAEKYGVPDLIKLDVEGAENLVLEGGAKVFGEHRPLLIVEVHGEEVSRGFYNLMARYNYQTETCSGVVVTDRTYHHQMVCRPR
jgi:FkbM family methyltransferase